MVVRSDYHHTFGNFVIVRHKIDGVQYESLYAHLNDRVVAADENVIKGQFIGNMGITGDSVGKHLHFELYKNEWKSSMENALNPELFLPKIEYINEND